MYALDIVGRSTKTLITVVSNQLSKVIFPSQIAGVARYGTVAVAGVLWVTHPYGVRSKNSVGSSAFAYPDFTGEFC